LQSVCPLGQTHAPVEQIWSARQAWPHAPQLAGSLEVLTQLPAQLVCPDAQVTVQVALEQTWFDAHTCPQPPQLSWSEASVTQAPEQFVVPDGHVSVHPPLTQT
jgi:hypothetical protein